MQLHPDHFQGTWNIQIPADLAGLNQHIQSLQADRSLNCRLIEFSRNLSQDIRAGFFIQNKLGSQDHTPAQDLDLGSYALGYASSSPGIKRHFSIKVWTEEHAQLCGTDIPAEIIILQADPSLLRKAESIFDQAGSFLRWLAAEVDLSQVDPGEYPAAVNCSESQGSQAYHQDKYQDPSSQGGGDPEQ